MVLIDTAVWRKGSKRYCHMVSDASVAELHAFAERVGRKRCWYERSRSGVPHYDLDQAARVRWQLAQ